MGQTGKEVLKSFLQAAPRQDVFSPEQKLWRKEPRPSLSFEQIIGDGGLTWVSTRKKKPIMVQRQTEAPGSPYREDDIESEIQ